jgi:O-antigen/teichoic acid export membrane protein
VTSALGFTAAIIVLYVADAVSVGSVAISTFASSLVGLIVLLWGMRSRIFGGLAYSRQLLREGLSYGLRTWVGFIAVQINAGADQLLMIGLSTSRELGLYVIAVMLSVLPNAIISSAGSAIVPRVAAGDERLAPQVCRLSMFATALAGVIVAPVAYPFLLYIFGDAFLPAYPMVLILLVAQVPASGSVVLGYALRGAGRPGSVSIADGVALLVTLPGAFLLIPALGGVGAAIVSLVAYGSTFALLLIVGKRHFGGNWWEYVACRPREVATLVTQARRSAVAAIRGVFRRRGGTGASQ